VRIDEIHEIHGSKSGWRMLAILDQPMRIHAGAGATGGPPAHAPESTLPEAQHVKLQQ